MTDPREAGVEAARKLVEEISNIDMPYEVDRCESYMCEHWASKAAVIIAAHTEAALAQVTTDLAGAEATNALLDEEVARLRAAFATSSTDEEQRLRGLFECIATDMRRGTAFESWARQWAREALRRAPTEPTR